MEADLVVVQPSDPELVDRCAQQEFAADLAVVLHVQPGGPQHAALRRRRLLHGAGSGDLAGNRVAQLGVELERGVNVGTGRPVAEPLLGPGDRRGQFVALPGHPVGFAERRGRELVAVVERRIGAPSQRPPYRLGAQDAA
jgi:hypothetical protein